MEAMHRNPEAVAQCIREAQTIAVVSHVNPDGDTIGSATAMRLILQAILSGSYLNCHHYLYNLLLFLSFKPPVVYTSVSE